MYEGEGEGLSDKEWLTREVYALFGLAIYKCQVLEAQLVNHLVVLRLRDGPQLYRHQVPDLEGALQGRTMGTNVKAVLKALSLPESLVTGLQGALELRNWLAHHYFWERADRFITLAGMESMRTELGDEIVPQLNAVDAELTEATLEVSAAFGMTREVIEAELEQVMAEIRDSGGIEWNRHE
ncbi:MAG TPA: hypothetical protein VFT74_13620 [Isosphaeraceae bacterium]|nr:hypothetical protein [Isosphaeraceae bacterium]